MKYELLSPFTDEAEKLARWIPKRIKQHITERLGIVPLLKDANTRAKLAEPPEKFQHLIRDQIDRDASKLRNLQLRLDQSPFGEVRL